MLIPAVSVIAAITLLPALLAVLGTRINSVRVMPKRFVDRGHPEDGAWGRWARFVLRRPVPVAVVGLVIVGVLVGIGTAAQPERVAAEELPRHRRRDRRAAQLLAAAGISPGVMKPFDVLVEHGGNAQAIAAKVRTRPRRRRRESPRRLAPRRRLARRGVPDRRRRGARDPGRSSTASTQPLDGHRRHARRRRGEPTATSCTPSTATSRTCSRS